MAKITNKKFEEENEEDKDDKDDKDDLNDIDDEKNIDDRVEMIIDKSNFYNDLLKIKKIKKEETEEMNDETKYDQKYDQIDDIIKNPYTELNRMVGGKK